MYDGFQISGCGSIVDGKTSAKIRRLESDQKDSMKLQAPKLFFAILVVLMLSGCAGSILKFENSEAVLQNKEFDTAIKVKELEEPAPVAAPTEGSTQATGTGDGKPAVSSAPTTVVPSSKVAVKKATPKKTKKGKALPVDTTPKPREPRTEDDEGFVGRRPIKDPYRVGEEVVLDISYFALDAGELKMQTRSFVEVNGRRAYRFHATARTVSVFESFYKVDDYAETLVDFETLLPFSYTLDVKESKVLRDARAVHETAAGQPGKMKFWDKKITKESGVEERTLEWEMLPYSQNIFSAIWYLRAFTLTPGKKIKINMAHEGENITVTCEVLRREKLSTSLGKLDTVVISPTAEKNGQPHNIGTNLFWLTDDDSKLMVRMESKIKIGKIVGSLSSLKK